MEKQNCWKCGKIIGVTEKVRRKGYASAWVEGVRRPFHGKCLIAEYRRQAFAIHQFEMLEVKRKAEKGKV